MLNSDTSRKLRLLHDLFEQVKRDKATLTLENTKLESCGIHRINEMFDKYHLIGIRFGITRKKCLDS